MSAENEAFDIVDRLSKMVPHQRWDYVIQAGRCVFCDATSAKSWHATDCLWRRANELVDGREGGV